MKCPSCGYSLWNLREPRCPECGESFNVEDWTFEPGTVRFHCNRCNHALPHRRPGHGTARCFGCNEAIAWSDVCVVPVSELAEEATTRGWRWTGVGLGWQVAGAVLALFLWALVIPVLSIRPSPPSITAHAAFVIAFALAALAGVGLAPRDKRRKAGVVWLCMLLVLSGLTVWDYRDAQGKWEQYIAWREPHTNFQRLQRLSEVFTSNFPVPHDWEQFTSSFADSLPLIHDLKALPDQGDWMRSGAMYVDTRALFLSFQESLREEPIVVAFAVTDHGGTEFVILTNAGQVRRTRGSDWISDQNESRLQSGLSPLPPFEKGVRPEGGLMHNPTTERRW